MSGLEASLIVAGVKFVSSAAKQAYDHAVQHQELAVGIANQTGAELRYIDHFMQYGRTALSPDDPNIKPSSDSGWTFSKADDSGERFGTKGLMRFTLGDETVFIAWNVPDPWGALFPWMRKEHRNNFDVKVVATQDVEGMTTEQIAKTHDLGSGIKLWRSDDKWVLRNLDEDVHFEFGAGRRATVRMTKSWKAGSLSVVLR